MERKRDYIFPVCPFPTVIFSISDWVIQGSYEQVRNIRRVSWSLLSQIIVTQASIIWINGCAELSKENDLG